MHHCAVAISSENGDRTTQSNSSLDKFCKSISENIFVQDFFQMIKVLDNETNTGFTCSFPTKDEFKNENFSIDAKKSLMISITSMYVEPQY